MGKKQHHPNGSHHLICGVMYTTTPGVANSGGVELAIANYVRLAITNNTTNFAAASGSGTRTKVGQWGTPLTWFTAGATSGNIVATGLLDASTAGNPLAPERDCPFGSQQVITSGNNITFNATDFSWSLT